MGEHHRTHRLREKTCKKKAAALRKLISEANGTQKEAAPKSGEANGTQKEAAPKSGERKDQRRPAPRRKKRAETDRLWDLLNGTQKGAAPKSAEGEARRPPEPRRKKSAETDALRDLLQSLDETVATKLLADVNIRYPPRVDGRWLDLSQHDLVRVELGS